MRFVVVDVVVGNTLFKLPKELRGLRRNYVKWKKSAFFCFFLILSDGARLGVGAGVGARLALRWEYIALFLSP